MKIELRTLQATDKETYITLAREVWVTKNWLDDTAHTDFMWKSMFSETDKHYTILTENQICGFASIMKLDNEIQELGLELFEKYQHQGVGYAALLQLLKICQEEFHMQKIQSKVYADNYPSILLMRKIGGIPSGITRNLCIDDDSLQTFETNNKNLISDNMKNVAKLFGVNPQLLLSNLLLFQIPVQYNESHFNVSLTGNLCYSKDIETCAMNHMLNQTVRFLESLK